MNRPRVASIRGPLELIEEGVHLVRRSPPGVLLQYYAGSIPFVMGLLYFVVDMSRHPRADDRCAGEALALALLFAWMKWRQCLFARGLMSQVSGQPGEGASAGGNLSAVASQFYLQATALFLLPVSALTILGLGWTWTFYQNVTVLGLEGVSGVAGLARRAAQQANRLPGQNQILLLLLGPLALLVFLNVAVALYQIPGLLRMLFGIETSFNLGGQWFNSTFLSVVFALTYLTLDPLVKAIHVLRCFYGDAAGTGADLRAELRGLRGIRGLILAACLFLPSGLAWAQTPAAAPVITAGQLDQSIERTLEKSEFAWRLPSERKAREAGASEGLLGRFLDGVSRLLRNIWRTVRGWLSTLYHRVGDLIDWLRQKLMPNKDAADRGQGGAAVLQRIVLFTLLAVVACVVTIFAWRLWRGRKARQPEILAEPVAALPDLADDSVVADQLPEEGWLKMAREMMERGDFRLALRAFYLASLALLARREMISIARFKSNQDYLVELRRRARAQLELQQAFAQNVVLFDRAWYGRHEVNAEALEIFQANLARLKP